MFQILYVCINEIFTLYITSVLYLNKLHYVCCIDMYILYCIKVCFFIGICV
jgi:hypothetical protein